MYINVREYLHWLHNSMNNEILMLSLMDPHSRQTERREQTSKIVERQEEKIPGYNADACYLSTIYINVYNWYDH